MYVKKDSELLNWLGRSRF